MFKLVASCKFPMLVKFAHHQFVTLPKKCDGRRRTLATWQLDEAAAPPPLILAWPEPWASNCCCGETPPCGRDTDGRAPADRGSCTIPRLNGLSEGWQQNRRLPCQLASTAATCCAEGMVISAKPLQSGPMRGMCTWLYLPLKPELSSSRRRTPRGRCLGRFRISSVEAF